MKSLICFLLLLFICFFPVSAQSTHDETLVGRGGWRVPPLPVEEGQLVYKGEVKLEGLTKEVLYRRAQDWLKHNMKSDDLDMRPNRKEGRIGGLGKITYNQSVLMNNAAQGIYFDYDIRVNDGSYSYRIDNIRRLLPGSKLNYSAMYQEELNNIENAGTWTHKERYEMLSDLNSFMTLMIQGLKNAMIKD